MATIFKTKDGRWRAQVRKQVCHPSLRILHARPTPRVGCSDGCCNVRQRRHHHSAQRNDDGRPVDPAYQRDVKVGRTTNANLERISLAIGSVPVRRFNETTVQTFVDARIKEGITGATIAGDLSGLSSVLRYARRAKHIAIDDGIAAAARRGLTARKISTRSKMRSRIPTPEEFERVVAHIEANPRNTIPTAQIARFLRLTVQCASVKPQASRSRTSSTTRARYSCPTERRPQGADTAALVPVLPEAMQILTEAAQGRSEGRVWPYNSQSVSTAWARAATAVGLQGLRLHDMRRAATTDLAKIGLSAPLIQTVTGHKSSEQPAALSGDQPRRLSQGIRRRKEAER